MSPGQLVVRRELPWRRRWLGIALLTAALAGGLGLYRLGGYHAGLDRAAISQERRAHNREVADLRRMNQSLRERVTLLETSRDIDRKAYQQIEASLADLHAQLQRKSEEVQFYRGIVSPEDRVPGLRVERAEIRPAGGERRFLLSLVVVQALRQENRLEGDVELTLLGSSNGEPASLNLAQWLVDETRSVDLSFSFRYFQELAWEFRLPDNFAPERVHVELRPGGRDAVPLKTMVDWPRESEN